MDKNTIPLIGEENVKFNIIDNYSIIDDDKDDIYNDMRGYITNNDYINLENTLEYLISLDPNAFNTYYYLNRLILTAMGRLGDFHRIKSLQLLLKYGAQINTILGVLPRATRYAVNLLYNNMTIFTRIIYNLLRDISDGLDLNTHINEKNEIYTMFKIILNYPIDYNKGDPNFFDVLELHPNEAHIVLEIFDRASIDINKFKSEQRLSFAKSFPKTGLPENLYNSVMEHLDYDAFQELGTYINKDKYLCTTTKGTAIPLVDTDSEPFISTLPDDGS